MRVSAKGKLCAYYLLLVGIPFLTLFGVLRAGRELRAPLFVAGKWHIEVDRHSSAQFLCLQGSTGSKPLTLTITQSGTRLTAGFDQDGITPEFHGWISDGTMELDSPLDKSVCGSFPLSLVARVFGSAQHRTFIGAVGPKGPHAPSSVRLIGSQAGPQRGY